MSDDGWTVADAIEDFERILKPGIDFAEEAPAALAAMHPAVAEHVRGFRFYYREQFWARGARSREPLSGAREPAREFAWPVVLTGRERQEARVAAVRAGTLQPPATEILDAWTRAERRRGPGSTDVQLRAAAAWEKTGLQRWYAGDDAGAEDAFARAAAIIDAAEPPQRAA